MASHAKEKKCVVFIFVCIVLTEPGVGLGIGVCCLALENNSPAIYIHSLAPGSVAKMDGRLRYMPFKMLDLSLYQ